MSHLNVAEAFGPTLQGEGPNAGQLASFLRLSGCNLSCSWCDTPFTWDWTRYVRADESRKLTTGQVAGLLSDLPGRIVVSGGEPLLQTDGLHALMYVAPRTYDVETNGTRPLGPTAQMWSTIVVSPKVGPSAAQETWPDAIRADQPNAIWKFVIAHDADLAAADEYVTWRNIDPAKVWLMPEGTDADTLAARWPTVAQQAVDRGYNATHRLHVAAWGDERGR